MATSTNWPGASTLSPSGRARVLVREQRAPRLFDMSNFHFEWFFVFVCMEMRCSVPDAGERVSPVLTTNADGEPDFFL